MKHITALLLFLASTTQANAGESSLRERDLIFKDPCKDCTSTRCADYQCCYGGFYAEGRFCGDYLTSDYCIANILPNPKDYTCDWLDQSKKCCPPQPTPQPTKPPSTDKPTFSAIPFPVSCVCSPRDYSFKVFNYDGAAISLNLCLNNPLKDEPGVDITEGSSSLVQEITACLVEAGSDVKNLQSDVLPVVKSVEITKVVVSETLYKGKVKGSVLGARSYEFSKGEFAYGQEFTFRSVSDNLRPGRPLEDQCPKLKNQCTKLPDIPEKVNVKLSGTARDIGGTLYSIKISLSWDYTFECGGNNIPFLAPVDFWDVGLIFEIGSDEGPDPEWCDGA